MARDAYMATAHLPPDLDYDAFLNTLDNDTPWHGDMPSDAFPSIMLPPHVPDPGVVELFSALEGEDADEATYVEGTPWQEIVVGSNEQARQAGADAREGAFIKRLKTLAETQLYVFSKAVMGRGYLTKSLHLPLCESLQRCPPFRKLRLLPRDHAKTSVVAHCLPAHILIQPPETNPYFPKLRGTECRIMLSGETERRAVSNLRVIATAFESNTVLRALWPEVIWENLRRHSKKWNDKEIILPRETEYPDPSVFAIGVGGAITGARPNVIIKDDLISLEAANSDVVMATAIEWHKASRALMDEYEKDTGQESLEFIIGTRWAAYDLYSFIMHGGDETPADATMDIDIRAIIEDGKTIWPERFNEERIAQLRREHGSMFYLLYMNTAADASLTDFNLQILRPFTFIETPDGMAIDFAENDLDVALVNRIKRGEGPAIEPPAPRGQHLTPKTWGTVFGEGKHGRGEWMRLKYA